MSLFDSMKGALFQGAEGEAQSLISGAIQNAPGGLGGVLQKLQAGGLGAQVSSWMASGQNLPISADQIQAALGDEHVQQIASHLGVPVDQLMAHLAEHLPAIASASAVQPG